MQNRIEKLVIVGGGTAGWMVAASLSVHFRNNPVKIELVESSAIGTVGVGESTIPSIRRFYKALGMQDAEVIKATNASCKLAIRFDGWSSPGQNFYHPFGLYGQDVNQIPFHQYWLKMHQLGHTDDISDYSLGVALAKAEKFDLPMANPPSPLSIFDWALHFDAHLFAKLMKVKAEANGVNAIDAKIEKVQINSENGFIEALELDNGSHVSGDLFIDCSGFKSLLIEEALNTGYENWNQWLFCDRAVAMQSELDDPENSLPPYTRAIAHRAGWQWKIPLQHRQGNGYVYSSEHISDEQALETLFANVDGKQRTQPNYFQFIPGRRKQAWNKNCIAVGLSAGFLEPLESTSIALIETAIDKIKMLFPDKSCNQAVVNEFNEMTALEYERVRDFIILHYKLNGRNGQEFWDACRDMDIPDTLAHKIELFKERGHLVKYRWEIFQSPSWISMYHGFNCLPNDYDPAVDNLKTDYLVSAFAEMKKNLQTVAETTRTHKYQLDQLLRQNIESN